MNLETIGRDEFITRRFRYRPGEHVTVLGSTGSGKTHLCYQLLGQVSRPELPAVSLVMKPRDATVRRFAKANGHKIVRHWPPFKTPFHGKPPGYVLWPKHTHDPDRDNATLWREFRACILDSYKRGNRILFADETAGLTDELGLKTECVALWTRGRSMGTGLWAASQRPAYIPLHAYTNSEHLFLAYEADKRGRDRFREIGGVDAKLVSDTVLSLGKYQWLYIRRTDRTMCIVDK